MDEKTSIQAVAEAIKVFSEEDFAVEIENLMGYKAFYYEEDFLDLND